MHTLFKTLATCHLFSHLSPIEIEQFLSTVTYKIKTLNVEDILFDPFDIANQIAVLLSGSLDVQKIFPDGKMIILERKKPTETIAADSLFSSYPYYPSTVVANKTSKVLLIHKNDMINLFQKDMTFMQNFLASVSDTNLLMKHRVAFLSLDSIRGKIAGYLLYYFKTNHTMMISLPFSKKEWAEYMDISRTSLSRELKHLKNENIIDFHERTIKILDLNRLEKILSQ